MLITYYINIIILLFYTYCFLDPEVYIYVNDIFNLISDSNIHVFCP